MIADVIPYTTSPVKLAHGLIAARATPGTAVIDATVGNGHDTLFLLNCVKSNGQVYGFDIQKTAIDAATNRLQDNPNRACVHLFQASHTEMASFVPVSQHGNIAAIMFNLGYLPGGDKNLITRIESTLGALDIAINLLAADGLLTLLAYPGHQGGDEESEGVGRWCARLNPNDFNVTLYQAQNANARAPQLYKVNKLR